MLRFASARMTRSTREISGDRHVSHKAPRVARWRSDRSRVKAVLVDRDDNVVNPAEIEIVPGPELPAARV